jgi:hypothetical protein
MPRERSRASRHEFRPPTRSIWSRKSFGSVLCRGRTFTSPRNRACQTLSYRLESLKITQCEYVKAVVFSTHALGQMADRGTNQDEVEIAVREGEEVPAKQGRRAFRKNFPFGSQWKGRYYESKQVMPVVADELDRYVVITVYVFYFGGKP